MLERGGLPDESEGRAGFIPASELFDQEETDQENQRARGTGEFSYSAKFAEASGERLTAEEETLLAHQIQEGKRAAEELLSTRLPEEDRAILRQSVEQGWASRDELVVRNLRLVSWFARKSLDLDKQQRLKERESPYPRFTDQPFVSRAEELDYNDRLQTAAIGLIRAAEDYQPDKGARFATYAIYHLRGQLLRDAPSELGTPDYMKYELHRFNKARDKLENEQGQDINYEALATELGWGLEKTIFVHDAAASSEHHSFEQLALQIEQREADEPLSAADQLVGPNPVAEWEERLSLYELDQRLDEAISTLDERSQKVMEMRYGLGGYDPMTLEEIGSIVGVSQERIRQIEMKALSHLRHPKRSDKLRQFFPEKIDPHNGLRPELKITEAEATAQGSRPPLVKTRRLFVSRNEPKIPGGLSGKQKPLGRSRDFHMDEAEKELEAEWVREARIRELRIGEEEREEDDDSWLDEVDFSEEDE